MCVYKITNSINEKVYVGQTVFSAEKRFKRHISDAISNKNENNHFHNAIRLYGSDVFSVETIVDNVPEELIDDLETNCIAMEDSFINGYNTLEYGASARGYKRTRESIEKQRSTMLKKGNHFAGKKHSEETLRIIGQKVSASNTGKKRGNYAESECPHCGKTGRGGNMKRYHFNNCKSFGVNGINSIKNK